MPGFRQLALIGCGLMGGSFALAAREAGLAGRIAGCSRPDEHARDFLARGVIDRYAGSVAEAVAQADLVMLAVPVAALPGVLAELAPCLAEGTLLMDVGSTKRSVVEAAGRALGPRLPDFVPAHPIAGKERAGPGDPFAALYHGRQVILTPLACTDPRQLARARAVWTAIGAQPRVMTPEEHDRGLAAVSHLPHLLAFAYMNGLLEQPDAQRFLALGGPGFRDFSRIAGCDPTVWRDILVDNRDQVLDLLASFRQALDAYETAITADHPAQLSAMLQRASDARIQWQPGEPGHPSAVR